MSILALTALKYVPGGQAQSPGGLDAVSQHWRTRFGSGGNAKTRATALALCSQFLRSTVAREPLQEALARGFVLVADEPHVDHPASEGIPLVFRFAGLRADSFLVDSLRRSGESELQGRLRLVRGETRTQRSRGFSNIASMSSAPSSTLRTCEAVCSLPM